jgi:SAM-dependent methyltransferase
MQTSMSKMPPSGLALVQARGGRFGDKVYVCANGFRHYVPSVERLAHYGLRWPDDLVQVPDQVLASFAIGGWLPTQFDDSVRPSAIESSLTMREYIASRLRGTGLEVGAGASPFPVPLDCRVIFGDRIPYEQLVDVLYPGQGEFELVRPDVLTDFDDFDGLANESLDFIIGCHVIEHVFDPIGAVVNAYQKLRSGGTLVLVVPDMARTFDRDRPLTSLDHLLLDHRSPDAERDRSHYEEFYRLAFRAPEAERAAKVEEEFRRRGDLHAHVWNYDTFGEMVRYVDANLAKWSSILSFPTLAHPQYDIEFYYTLTK